MVPALKAWYISTLTSFLSGDVPRLLGLPPAAFARDVTRLEQRLACEGESFLTKTLPLLGRNFDSALQGNVALTFPGFKAQRKASLPVFLQALTSRVFTETGWLRIEPCIKSIKFIRQICFWCKKIEKGYSDESLQTAVADFIEVDNALPPQDHVFHNDAVLSIARRVIVELFRNIGPILEYTPRHGPGAVADGRNAVEKRDLSRSFTDLESAFRPIPWFFSWRDASEDYRRITDRFCCKYGLSRLAFVFKDSGGPRLINLEEAEYMWCQQSVKSWMYDYIENYSFVSGYINFTDQTVNRNKTVEWMFYETLDMSKASDRLSYALVKTLFEKTRLWRYMRASRSPGTVLPDGRVHFYRKFAPMGSAVCFPTQACVYYALAVAVIHLERLYNGERRAPLGHSLPGRNPAPWRDLERIPDPPSAVLRSVFVYGDDLIVPRAYFGALKAAFERVDLKFNTDKCCTHGKFRESCGLDAFAGVDVTPVRMRKVHETERQSVFSSIVAHANELYKAGYWDASISLRKAACAYYPYLRKMRVPFTTRGDEPILAWLNYELDTVRVFMRKHDQITYVRGWTYVPKKVRCRLALEGRFLRESLSLEGPVGDLNTQDGCRYLTKRYGGKLRKRKLPYLPRVAGSGQVGLINRC